MHIIENYINTNNEILPLISYFDGLKGAVVDIETTGLSPSKDTVFLIGVLSKDNDKLKITQFLASDFEDEKNILVAFFDFVKNFDILLSYNGTSFDIPFVNKRSKLLKINKEINLCRSIDYLKIFRASYLPNLFSDMKLKTVEKYAGVFRRDKLSGKQCISLYSDFVLKQDINAGKKVVFHNFEDLSCFPALNKLIGKIDIHTALFNTGFPIKSNNSLLFVQNIKPLTNCIKVLGIISDCSIDWAFYENNLTFISDHKTGAFSLEIFNHNLNSEELMNKRLVNTLIINQLSELNL